MWGLEIRAAKNSSAAKRALAPARSRTAGIDRDESRAWEAGRRASLSRGAVHGDLGNDNLPLSLITNASFVINGRSLSNKPFDSCVHSLNRGYSEILSQESGADTVDLKNKPLQLSLVLAVLELAIWLLLGVLSTSSCENLYDALLNYSAERFGAIVIAISTTFYVVFTYRLLANSEIQRRISTQPYLMVRWYQDSKSTEKKLGQMQLFASEARSLLIQQIGFDSSTIDESNMATGDRYLILELSNVRKTPLGWVTIALNGTLETPDGTIQKRLKDELHLKDLNLRESKNVEVTMVDLFPIPQPAKVTLNIEVVTYGAVDMGDIVDKISGDSQASAFGVFIPATKDPQPK